MPGGDRGQWLVVDQRFAVDEIAMYPSEAKGTKEEERGEAAPTKFYVDCGS